MGAVFGRTDLVPSVQLVSGATVLRIDAGARASVLGYAADPVREQTPSTSPTLRFGSFELDTEAGQLTKDGRIVRLQPQPFKLLWLLCSQPGRLVTRDEIRSALWTGDTFVDFEQGVNFAIKQVREALGDDAERSVFVQTVPRRGYRFIAPVQLVTPRGAHGTLPGTDLNLQKVLWSNIAELRLLQTQRDKRQRQSLIVVAAILSLVFAIIIVLLLR